MSFSHSHFFTLFSTLPEILNYENVDYLLFIVSIVSIHIAYYLRVSFDCQPQFMKKLWLMTLYIINSKSFYCVWNIINLRILIVAMIEDKMIQVLGHIKYLSIYILSSRLLKGGQEEDDDKFQFKIGSGIIVRA